MRLRRKLVAVCGRDFRSRCLETGTSKTGNCDQAAVAHPKPNDTHRAADCDGRTTLYALAQAQHLTRALRQAVQGARRRRRVYATRFAVMPMPLAGAPSLCLRRQLAARAAVETSAMFSRARAFESTPYTVRIARLFPRISDMTNCSRTRAICSLLRTTKSKKASWTLRRAA